MWTKFVSGYRDISDWVLVQSVAFHPHYFEFVVWNFELASDARSE